MKTSDILNLNFKDDESKVIIQKALRKLKPFEGIDLNEEIPLIKIEKFIGICCRKYAVMIQYISPTYIKDEENMYACSIKTTDKHEWLGNVYGYCLYELMAKTAIKIFYEVKTNDIPEQNWDKFKDQKRKKMEELLEGKNNEA